jgi:uncharacterized membrane protein YraQ (UPF0718 family)
VSASRFNKRIWILATVTVALTVWFATSSRMPALNQKASSAGVLSGGGAISFDPILDVQEDDPYWQKIAYSSVNWANTNKKGMAFGISIATLFLTLLRLIPPRVFRSRALNTVYGAVSGTPLGLCVNCSAPIATGIYYATQRAEAALALMVSSPTLNVIVLSMCFALFPPGLAILKIVFSIAVIACIPFLVKPERLRPIEVDPDACEIPGAGSVGPLVPETWLESFRGVLVDLWKNLRFVLVRTVPLMLLAGVLGAVAVHTIDLDGVFEGPTRFLALAATSLFGTFLPVPMAFDIISAQILLSAGVSKAYVMALLFTLGAFSVYSFSIVWKTISRQIAVMLYAIVSVAGVAAGYTAEALDRVDAARVDQIARTIFPEAPAEVRPEASLAAAPPGLALEPVAGASETPDDVRVDSRTHEPRNAGAGPQFQKLEGHSLGLFRYDRFAVKRFLPPYRTGRGVASGDYNNDGWTDLLVATDEGFSLYKNVGGREFVLQELRVPGSLQTNVFFVALVDFNDDGWLDIFASSYREDDYFYLSDAGGFDVDRHVRLEGGAQNLAKVVTFGDVDRDGDLDFYIGNWYHPGPTHGRPWKHNRNALVFNEDGALRAERLPEASGVTQSALFTDIDGDRNLDLVVANDFAVSDYYFIGDGAGGFRALPGGPRGVPVTPRLSMSIDSGDVDNDLSADLFLTNTGGSFESSPLTPQDHARYCDEVQEPISHDLCRRLVAASEILVREQVDSGSFEKCEALDAPDREECLSMVLTLRAINSKDRSLCRRIPQGQASVRADCVAFFDREPDPPGPGITKVRQVNQKNILLKRSNGSFENVAKRFGAENTAWSWAGKFGDLDNDEWQDIYVTNGSWGWGKDLITNVFLHNRGGEGFDLAQAEFGLEDHPVTSGFTYLDLDNDGDLDLVTNAVNAPLRVYVNRETERNAITFELRDHRGNRFGIGSRLVIGYGDGKRQFREIKAGGGFVSFDGPWLHFGLGSHERIEVVEVQWSTGETSRIEGPLEANRHYVITRDGEGARTASQ